MSSRYQLKESPKGNGKVFRESQFLAGAGYSLAVTEEQARAGNEWLEGDLEIDGVLTGRSTWEDLEGSADDPFTLHLADGRRLNFLFISFGTGRIKGTGNFYREQSKV
jgi:hypothetical protein